MPYNFCTLFDKNFLARGLALYDSLKKQCPDFTLWILCMDEESYSMLGKLALPKVKPLKISEVEDARMLAVKPTRTAVEYCWMFSSALPLYILEKNPQMESVTYLDADLYFYAPPADIYREFGESSIGIIEHGFSDENEHRLKTSGIYNVGMMIFKNDKNALECLNWWKDRCIEWCFNRYEDGKFGDQLYLNDWPTRFRGVCVIENNGANVASWNIGRYSFRKDKSSADDSGFSGKEESTGKKFPLIFYHFHGLKIYAGNGGRIQPYPATIYERRIYSTYLKALNHAYGRIRMLDTSWKYGCAAKLDILRIIKQYIALYAWR